MLWKLLLVVAISALAFGGQTRLRALLKSARRLPSSFREGKARAEDPVPFAHEVKGSAKGPRTTR
jgi:Sec-independent protein translocase protein TatA